MYERYLSLITLKGLRSGDVAKMTGLSPTVFSEWKKGKSSPNAEKLLKIARCLHVSMEYLMTGQESEYALTPFEYALILAYRQQDELGQAIVDRVLNLEDVKKEAAFTA